MTGFTSVEVITEDKQYIYTLDAFSNVDVNIESNQYINTLDSFLNVEVNESCTYYLSDAIIVDILYPGIVDLSINTIIRSDTMFIQNKGVNDLSIDTVISNQQMITQNKGVTDLSVSPTPYWDPVVISSQNYQK